ncbi:MAG TPA: hypothetical protein VFV96_07650 [Verrucomicrobiae bacterium]|nr:hypothetical protein [Verrucomicrobiae bacterium]
MFAKYKRLLLVLAAVGAATSASAFALLGPYAAWQTTEIGYNPLDTDIGGPMNIGEEYRWNIKTIYYGYDESFWNFFGPKGTNAIDRALTILNALPPVSQMSSNLAEFPTDTTRPNYTAQALGIMDLKSLTLSALLEEMGLASAERYVWTLRSKQTVQNIDYYTVVKRNFDPITWNYSSYVNGVLYEFAIIDPVYQDPAPQFADAIEFRADGLSYGFNTVASGIDDATTPSDLGDFRLHPGYFFTGLTRDDVGGLRYLYLPSNIQYESLSSNSVAGGSSSPWQPAGGTNANGSNSVVSLALRGGVDKITFKQVRYDSLVGVGYFQVETNTYTDFYYTNSVLKSQNIQRVVDQPDIVFAAADLGLSDGVPILFRRTDTSGWANNDAINGSTTLDGPGVIQGSVFFTYSKLGPYMYGLQGYYPADGASSAFSTINSLAGFIWGSFDGTTNPPVVFPTDVSIQDLEWLVLQGGGSGGGSPFSIPRANITTNTTATTTQ